MSVCPILKGLAHMKEIYCPFKRDWDCPEPCPYVPILKILAEAVEVADLQIRPHQPRHKHPLSKEWIQVEFWIRREGER